MGWGRRAHQQARGLAIEHFARRSDRATGIDWNGGERTERESLMGVRALVARLDDSVVGIEVEDETEGDLVERGASGDKGFATSMLRGD